MSNFIYQCQCAECDCEQGYDYDNISVCAECQSGEKHHFYDSIILAVEAERERIIKLLDNLACDNPFCRNLKIMRTHTGCRAVRHHISVIKGEK